MFTPQRCVPLLLVLLVVQPLSAQEGPVDALTAVRGQPQLSDEDRGKIRTFVSDKLKLVTSGEEAQAQPAAAALRAAYAGTDAFKQAYAEVCVELFGPPIAAENVRTTVRLLAVLATYGALPARPVFVRALEAKTVGVRAAAAGGLRGLQTQLAAAGADQYANTLRALKEAGMKERSRDTLRTIYAALDYTAVPQRPDLKPAAAAVLELLEKRLEYYGSEEEVPALGADDAGLAVMARLLPAMSEEERNRLTVLAATMTRYAVQKYRSPELKLYEVRDDTSNPERVRTRDAIERLVLHGEELLKVLVAPSEAPDVMKPMRELNRAEMLLEWNRWSRLLRDKLNRDFSIVDLPPDEGAAGAEEAGREE